MYLFLTSNIFIEKFTHVWAIFFMEMSRCKRENRATYLFTEFDGFVLIFTFFFWFLLISVLCSSKWINLMLSEITFFMNST